MIKNSLLFTFLCLFSLAVLAGDTTKVYRINTNFPAKNLLYNHIHMGKAKAPNGDSLSLTNQYLVKNGKPWFAMMGEFHFSRLPKEKWEESILKMKSNGITIIATYVFWSHHEEIEGKYDWTGDRDVRAFVALCAKHNMYVWLRIGPWCHGEVRNGGFPDWVLRKTAVRKSSDIYFQFVERLYKEIHQQTQTYYFKNGGTIIGTQIENEFNFKSKAGLEHMLTLKKLAIKVGIDLPYYSATSWPGTDPKQRDFVLMYGAYPEAPWSGLTKKLPANTGFLFKKLENDPSIGADLTGTSKVESFDQFPYLSAELGGGNQVTYHRRPFIDSLDCIGLTYSMLGSGANGLGYYMFHGGVNPEGKLSSLEENQQTAYPNDYSIIDYDFQSPLGQAGQLRPSYHQMRLLHYFVNEYGSSIAETSPFFASVRTANATCTDTLRCAVRAKDGKGFIFLNNFQRQVEMKDLTNLQLKIQTAKGELTFPNQPFTLKKNTMAIFPFNLEMQGVTLKYATAQPFTTLHNANETVYVFFAVDGIETEFVFDAKTVKKVSTKSKSNQNDLIISDLKASTDGTFEVTGKDGKKFTILLLTRSQALTAWKGTAFGKERLVLSNSEVLFDGGKIRLLRKGSSELSVLMYPKVDKKVVANESEAQTKILKDGIFEGFSFSYPVLKVTTNSKEDDTNSMNLAFALIPEFEKVMKKYPLPLKESTMIWNQEESDTSYFRKQFSVLKADKTRLFLSFVADDQIQVFLNGKSVFYGGKNTIVSHCELTNYLQKGDNTLGIRVDNIHNKGGVNVALFMVSENDITVLRTDTLWKSSAKLVNDWNKNGFNDDSWKISKSIKILNKKNQEPTWNWFSSQQGALYNLKYQNWAGMKNWNISTSVENKNYINDVFAEVDYTSDAIAIYDKDKLVNDEFYYGRKFLFSLGRLDKNYKTDLKFQLTPFTPEMKVYFEDDIKSKIDFNYKAKLNEVKLIPEYKVTLRQE